MFGVVHLLMQFVKAMPCMRNPMVIQQLECHVQSENQMAGFTSAHEYRALVEHISGACLNYYP